MTVQREQLCTGPVTKFRLLMWKNFLQQWRHPAQTATELLLPVITMLLVLILRSQIEPIVMGTTVYPPIRAHSLNYSALVLAGMNITQMSIAFSPRSDLLEEVVRSASARLMLQNVQDLLPVIIELIPDIPIDIPPDLLNSTVVYEVLKSLVKVDPYNTSEELRSIYSEEITTRKVIAAVEFDDSLFGVTHATELPSDLQYALRFPERPRLNSFYGQGGRSWRTDNVFPVFEIPGPRFPFSWEGGNDPGYVNEMFLALQHMLSTELISLLTDEDIRTFEVNVQRYPHPPYIQDQAQEALQLLFPMFMMLSFSYTAINIIKAITVEKELQLKEAMKIMGLPTWLHWTAWFCKQFIYLLFCTVLIVVILKVNWFTNEEGFSHYAVFTHTPWTVLFFYIALYLTCTIFFCFMISGFFSKANTAALFGGVIWYLLYIPAFLLSVDVNMSAAVQAFTCLSINSAMSYGFQLLLARESTGGMQWSEFLMSPVADGSRFLFGHVVLMLALDCIIYMLVALYMEQVLPGPYGTPKPWYFPLQRHFWFPNRKLEEKIVAFPPSDTQNITMEKDPRGHTVGVKMTNLTKIYGNHIAVNNLTLNIYDDQITVLLGHNGAGKSTTISMLTGNLEVTRGTVTLAGYDITKQSQLARSHIGLCPQHNVLFNELTVREHLEFFSRLKGLKGDELNGEIDTLIEKLELEDKRNYLAEGLSGGQKRRLSVGIALCGAARVVLLDEPTSGMDPASRRALWDLLQKEKKGRSMILTTHFMDEADILGDRVAIMANGLLQCVGSPYFLKKHYGVGYTLVVVKDQGFDYETCTDVIRKYIPETTIKEDRGTEVTYSLRNEFSHKFEAMLNDLETKIGKIKFTNYGLVATTLEDVFMSVGSDITPVHSSDSDDCNATTSDSYDDPVKAEYESSLDQYTDGGNIKGLRLWWQHVLAVWLKLWLVWTRSWQLVVLQVLVPILQVNATLGVLQYVLSLSETTQRRELTLNTGFTSTETLVEYNGTTDSSLGWIAKAAYTLLFNESGDSSMEITDVEQSLDTYYLERTDDANAMGFIRNRLLIGATFSDTSAVAWFSNFGYHDVAVSLAAVHKALLQAKNPNANLTVFNYPLEAHYNDNTNIQMMVTMLSMQLSAGIGSSVGLISAVYIMFYIKERISRAKLLQKASGIRPYVMWSTAAVFDWLWFLIICVTIVISCVAFGVIGLSSPDELGRMYVCFMVYGFAMLPLHYLFSYFFSNPAAGFVVMFFVNLLVGMMGPQIVEALWAPMLTTKHVADGLDAVLQFFPLYSLVTAVRTVNKSGLLEWSCLQGCEFLSAVVANITECSMQAMCENFSETCCVEENAHWNWDPPGVMRYIVAMLVSGAVLWAVLMVAEYRLVQKIFNRERRPPHIDESSLDEDVAAEAKHVKHVDTKLAEHSLVADRLSKYYGKHLAVDQVSFTVSATECFGLLGVNGAGKTTTFKMLMGDEMISSGDATVGGYSVKKHITNVYKNIGYCPQFDAVFPEFTGRETLRFFSMLRGLGSNYASSQIVVLAHSLGFTQHLDKKVEQYSGGNKRKLSTAVALLGRARLVFVDEPTTGVDPAAKRQVWNAVRRARREGRGVVLTSHSMEECEALCSRLTIMVNGRFKCLGTPQHLKNKFSEGFTLTIKMRMDETRRSVVNRPSGSSGTTNTATDAIKIYVNSNFKDPKIMEEYQGLLTYYLPDRTMPWSRMFGVMERAKQEFEVEDYSISQTTLEQIFLQFTKYQKENNTML